MAQMDYLEQDERLKSYSDKLLELRKDGVNKISDLRQAIETAKRNRLLDESERAKIISESNKGIEAAKVVAEKNKAEIAQIVKAAVARSNEIVAPQIKTIVAEQQNLIAQYKSEFAAEVEKIKGDSDRRAAEIEKSYAGKSSSVDLENKKSELKICSYEMSSSIFDAKNKMTTKIGAAKATINQAYTDHVLKNRSLRNGSTNALEDIQLSWQNYRSQFNMNKFLLANGLYIAIVIFFIICMVAAPLMNRGMLFSMANILTILEQSSTKMFYALGVAGLILIAGTDLSIGRMVAMGAVFTGLILHPGKNIVTFFDMGPWDFSALPTAVRLLMALCISIILCVAFSSFSGFFTAKFKMHPFISTLSTQLIVYGLMFFGTRGTPTGSIDRSIGTMLGGRMDIMGVSFPKLIIPAIIAIIVAWFIWNKTKFGKYMYAVGGNAEAASVSGINVFWVTMGIFIMAGVFYGFGSFLEAFRANASAGTGQGYELDAIAACVVGGISFSGGIGKISGAVIGVIIFTGLTYCLTFLGIDTNLQFVFKGIIIVSAVALDSIKYLKRK